MHYFFGLSYDIPIQTAQIFGFNVIICGKKNIFARKEYLCKEPSHIMSYVAVLGLRMMIHSYLEFDDHILALQCI